MQYELCTECIAQTPVGKGEVVCKEVPEDAVELEGPDEENQRDYKDIEKGQAVMADSKLSLLHGQEEYEKLDELAKDEEVQEELGQSNEGVADEDYHRRVSIEALPHFDIIVNKVLHGYFNDQKPNKHSQLVSPLCFNSILVLLERQTIQYYPNWFHLQNKVVECGRNETRLH
ncbi:hypothetical protein FGO68_gene653 [Halteria grandinella]|uniref:Uncharacterized protein n=1 Tax=Halteria grandinella TaxID=5974 RepID=A0A8J8NQD9_HALGN|nr:hypothetical protein FGO68_gene653 [Halteria grandinella]